MALAVLAAGMCPPAWGQQSTDDAIREANQAGHPVRSISPIFSQLVLFTIPAGFKTVTEATNQGARYIREMVLDGETVDQWSQMITITGAKGLAASPNVTPQVLANLIAGGFKRACPDTFATQELGALTISGQPAFVVWASCGTAPATPGAAPHSEAAVIFGIKGTDDYYTIQWAEREAASSQPLAFDGTKWTGRVAKLNPVKLCPIVPGERPPYVSCVEGK
ncbi:hypothetical protein [Nitrospirillum iridis]|uniref:Uncharacterized protein n=1 Tax=Nitrospirillum iridis TaxID=765888 RepID=A0A7X0B4B0_9PROT|nr:hypothetical protein [Nitrospirillum iridis]MBB6254711.1 hypothetical protein [Nitrospirillum iridis]